MSDLDFNAFDFANMKKAMGNKDPFATQTGFKTDDRFYQLTKDKDGNGVAVIAFLPDPERQMFRKIEKINTTITMNGKKRFVAEYSPKNAGLPCPFQERWQALWRADNKEEARKYARTLRLITNIKVIKDPANPANEGKIFLYDMSQSLGDMLKKALEPTQQEIALGEEPKEIFNPLKGWVLTLKCNRGGNGILTYEHSVFKNVGTNQSIYGPVGTDDEKRAALAKYLEDINANGHKISEFFKPEYYAPYEEYVRKLKWVSFEDITEPAAPANNEINEAPVNVTPVAPVSAPSVPKSGPVTPAVPESPVQVQQAAPAAPAKASDDVDNLLDDLLS